MGTHERFIGFLLEHYAGNFPLWLAPLQVKILPISDKFLDYARWVLAECKKAGIRAELDDRNEKIGKKIRDAELSKVPNMLIIGEKEMNEQSVSLRLHSQGDQGMKPVSDLVADMKAAIYERR